MFELNRDRVEALMKNIEGSLVELAKVTAKEFNDHDVKYMFVRLVIEGRTDGDAKILFTVGEDDYGENKAKGRRLIETYEEFARRQQWTKVNDPLMISFDSSGRVREEDHGVYVLQHQNAPLSGPIEPNKWDDGYPINTDDPLPPF